MLAIFLILIMFYQAASILLFSIKSLYDFSFSENQGLGLFVIVQMFFLPVVLFMFVKKKIASIIILIQVLISLFLAVYVDITGTFNPGVFNFLLLKINISDWYRYFVLSLLPLLLMSLFLLGGEIYFEEKSQSSSR